MNPDKTHTPENSNNGVGRLNKLAYRDGYLHNQDLEPNIPQEKHLVRHNNVRQPDKVSRGLLLGITLTTLIGLVGGTSFLLAQHYRQLTLPVETTSPAGSHSQSPQ